MSNDKDFLLVTVFFIIIILLIGSYIGFRGINRKLDSMSLELAALRLSNERLEEKCTAEPCPPAAVKAQQDKTRRLTRDDIYRIVFNHADELNACYQKLTNRRVDRRRRMIVFLAINNSGEVLDANIVNSDIRDFQVESCVISEIKNMRFPHFDGHIYRDEIYITFDARSLI